METEPRGRLALLTGAMLVLAVLLYWDRTTQEAPLPVAPRTGVPGQGTAKPSDGNRVTRLQPAGTGAANTPAVLIANPLATLDLKSLRDTIERPLFERGRRPRDVMVRSPPAVMAPRVNPNEFTLLGVLASKQRSIAVLRRNSSGQSIKIEPGQIIDSWRVERIEERHVVLKHETTEIVLELFKARK